MTSLAPQVDRSHYFNPTYLNKARFLGLYAQVQVALAIGLDRDYLEIGIGPGLFDASMKRLGARVLSVDFDHSLGPDVNASVFQLPFASGTFDVTCAFEVLEHLPWRTVAGALAEMRRVSSEFVVVSVPNQRLLDKPRLSARVAFGDRGLSKSFHYTTRRGLTNPAEHYWELGHEAFTADRFVQEAEAVNLKLAEQYTTRPYFHFFKFAV